MVDVERAKMEEGKEIKELVVGDKVIKPSTTTKKVSILGTEYEIIIDAPDEMLPENADGGMDHSIKRITVAKFETDRNTIKDIDSYRKKVLRHEIIHAFLYESGLWNNSGTIEAWGQNEEITDWIAIQFPKMLEVFEEVGCI